MGSFTGVNIQTPKGLWEEWLSIRDANGITSNQVSISNIPGHEDDPLYGTGSLLYDWNNAYEDADGSRTVPIFDNPIKEDDFTSISDIFRDTKFEIALNSVRSKYGKVGRCRIMSLYPNKCLSWHRDSEKRLHYPLKTNKKCLMVIGREAVHLTQGCWTLTDTLVEHTAFNGSNEVRTHIVCSILNA